MGWAKFNEDIQDMIEDRWVMRENIGSIVVTRRDRKRIRGEAERMNAGKEFLHNEFYRSVIY